MYLNDKLNIQSVICNNCHDLLMVALEINNIMIINVTGEDYCCISFVVDKSETDFKLF